MSYQPIGIEYYTFNNDRRPMVNICYTDKFNFFVLPPTSINPIKLGNGISIFCNNSYKEKTIEIFYNNINVFNIEHKCYYYFIKDIKPKTFIMIIEFLVEEDFITINFDK